MHRTWITIIKSLFLLISVFLQILFLNACDANSPQSKPKTKESTEETLEKANRYLVRSEEEQIKDLIRRYQWKMNATGTGLRYLIDSTGTGRKIKYGDKLTLKYTIRLLNGDVVKTSDETGPMQFVAGKGGVESGLEEGILMMRKGDKAKFILPSHLAFGLLGDGEKIPPRTALIYEVEISDIQ